MDSDGNHLSNSFKILDELLASNLIIMNKKVVSFSFQWILLQFIPILSSERTMRTGVIHCCSSPLSFGSLESQQLLLRSLQIIHITAKGAKYQAFMIIVIGYLVYGS